MIFMMNWEVNIQIDDPFRGSIDESWLRRAVEETLRAEGIDSSIELGLVVTGEERVRQLNQSYRGLDEPTDVISFALLEGDGSFVMPPDNVLHLGEVVISYPHAARQAQEQGHSIEREMAHLVIHGVLHLLGHEHEEAEDDHKMRVIEAEVLSGVDKKGDSFLIK